MPEQIRYRDGYRYQLAEDYSIVLPELRGAVHKAAINGWLSLVRSGRLTIQAGYAWDGASGPTFDTKSSMRGSLVHDGIYQLIRAGLLDARHRGAADKVLQRLCEEDGMWRLRSRLWERAVRRFAASAADPKSRKPVLVAP